MLNSLSYQTDATSVTVIFGQPYAAFHKFGTSKMPRRGMLCAAPNTGTLARDDEELSWTSCAGVFQESSER